MQTRRFDMSLRDSSAVSSASRRQHNTERHSITPPDGMLAPQDENEAEVRREDQERINQFARLNARLAQVKARLESTKKSLEHLDDASTELMMLSSGDPVWLSLGEGFVLSSDDEANQFCEAQAEELQAKVEALQQEESTILQEQSSLKHLLYQRFGKSINLETD